MPLRLTICLIAAALAPTTLHAQSVNLTEAPLAQRWVRIDLAMQLDGKITVKQDGKDISYPHKAHAKHAYMERFLDADAGKAHRVYTVAESTITFNNADSSKRSLREERRFLVAERVNGQIVSFSPKGMLTREEMELTEHFDTMAVAGLLPGKSIDVGKSWAIPNPVVLALCELDGITEQSLQGTLEAVKGNSAYFTIAGKANGINLGAQVEMEINARCEFDVKQQRILTVEWKETDKRQQGPITPALVADVTIKMTRTPIDEPPGKLAFLLDLESATRSSELTNIQHQDAKNRFAMSHARDWHVVSPEDSPQLVMRQIERGDFLAQVTITAWKKTDLKEIMALEKFADDMAKTPGWREDKENRREKLASPAKGQHTVYRVSASGELDGVRTVQYFYLLVGPQGEQLIVTFSVVPQHVQRLGTRDMEFVREIMFPAPK